MTLFITLKSGAIEHDTARTVKVDVKYGVLTLNEGTKQERVLSLSLVQQLTVEEREY